MDDRLIYEGKTKKIWLTEKESVVRIESKPILPAGDGKKALNLPGKDVWSNTTACNVFSFLENRGVKTHFLKKEDERSFLARRLKMIKLEFAVRRVAYGSYCKRYPEVKEGRRLIYCQSEVFLKDDRLRNPLITLNTEQKTLLLYDAKMPLEKSFIEEIPFCEISGQLGIGDSPDTIGECESSALKIFLILEKRLEELNVMLVDLKCEFGRRFDNNVTVAGDVIDNDSWSIWPEGRHEKMLDKEVFRKMGGIGFEERKILQDNYRDISRLSSLL